ncbi:branched-chain amino acid ABC transporter permease [Haladaptatus pallidirubidus]|uniref:Branched-chain amino acid ABC transporter permease n=1 Tax=Haladaptatus pallidirubidus TaxID=1008152 RepID=A0AAV3URV7_9EURY|nr:branched-chain amino acid ABC transporter permease [Haladaptatus pallidirubidus]
MVSPELIIQQIVNGVFFGGQLALIAVGLTLIWGVARVLNFSHGALFMIGGFVGFFALEISGSIFVAILSSILVVFAVGWIIEYALIEPLRDREEFDIASMVITLGFAIFIENAILVEIGSSRRAFPQITNAAWELAGITVNAQRLLIFLISVVALSLLFLVISRTKLGLAIRAVSQDSETALLMGIRPKRIYAITFGVSAALAGLAGVLLAPLFAIYPSVGWYPFLLAFIVVMVGGLGSVRGTLIAAIGLAVIRSLSMIWVASETAMIILFVIMIIILVATPDGIGGWISG